MPTVAQLVDALTEMTGERRARVNMMARRLIDDGLMPKSIGRDVAQVNAESVVNLLFAVAFAERGADATRTAREWGDLKWVHKDDFHTKTAMKVYGISPENNFREALISTLCLKSNTAQEISFLSTGPESKLGKIECHVTGEQLFESESARDVHLSIPIEFSNHDTNYEYLLTRVYLLSSESIFALHKFLRGGDLTASYISKTTPESEEDKRTIKMWFPEQDG
jgi:hypothetical protein